MPRSAPFAALLASALLLAPPLISCARNPVTGKNEISLVSESQEIEMGKEASQQTIQSIGLVNDPQLQEYVSGIGLKLAKASERPNLPWEYHVVNDASVVYSAGGGTPRPRKDRPAARMMDSETWVLAKTRMGPSTLASR